MIVRVYGPPTSMAADTGSTLQNHRTFQHAVNSVLQRFRRITLLSLSRCQ